MIPTILGLIQAISLQRAGTSSQKMVMAVQAAALCPTSSHSYGASPAMLWALDPPQALLTHRKLRHP